MTSVFFLLGACACFYVITSVQASYVYTSSGSSSSTRVFVSVVTDSNGTRAKMTKTTTTKNHGTFVSTCQDYQGLCSYWAMMGECDSSPETMKKNCKASCGACGAFPCQDKKDECKYWATTGQCQANPAYMLVNCRVSCGACSPGCRDQHRYCHDWSQNGECDNNPGYMHSKCKWSCRKC